METTRARRGASAALVSTMAVYSLLVMYPLPSMHLLARCVGQVSAGLPS